MDHPAFRHAPLELLKTAAFAPVLLGFLIGSLPVLLPLLLHRILVADHQG